MRRINKPVVMKFMSLGVFALVLFSCIKKVDLLQYEEGQQLLTLNNLTRYGYRIGSPLVRKISQDSILVKEELLVKIFLEKSDLEIVDAFFDCQPVTNPAVDTTTYHVRGCSKRLIVQNDTILIGFRPTELGLYEFPEITILTRDDEKIFRTYNYSFQYKVIGE